MSLALVPLSKEVCDHLVTGAAAEDVVEEEEMEDEEELGEEDEMADFIVDEEEVDEHGEPSKYCSLLGTCLFLCFVTCCLYYMPIVFYWLCSC
jgi:hypothetical protein